MAECYRSPVKPNVNTAGPIWTLAGKPPQLDAITLSGMTIRAGRAVPSDAPGLGIAWDWEAIDRLRVDAATRIVR